MEATILGTVKKRLWCLLDAIRVAVVAEDVSYPTPPINRRKDRLGAGHRGRQVRVDHNDHHQAGRLDVKTVDVRSKQKNPLVTPVREP